jgi:hypothetical protein
MRAVFTFITGETVAVEVEGKIKDFYLSLAVENKDEPPETISVAALEERALRKHTRAHKYTGFPVSYENALENGCQIESPVNEFYARDLKVDIERAMNTLTDFQRYCFIETCIRGGTHRDAAHKLGKSKTSVTQSVIAAKEKLKKALNSYDQRIPPAAIKRKDKQSAAQPQDARKRKGGEQERRELK